LEVFVKDRGIGIEPNRKEFLFKAFGELNAKQTMSEVKDQNLGLGLQSVYDIIKFLGGSVLLVQSDPN
jgi:signal transduction histidine kinase